MKNHVYTLLVGCLLTFTQTATPAQEQFDLPSVEVKAVQLKEVLSFEKYRAALTRIQSISTENVELVLTIDKLRPHDKLVLAQGEQQMNVGIAENGELLIPALEKVLQSDDGVLMVPKMADQPKITP